MTSPRHPWWSNGGPSKWGPLGLLAAVLVIVLIGGILHFSSKEPGSQPGGTSPTSASGSQSPGTVTDHQVTPQGSKVDLDAGSKELAYRTSWNKMIQDHFDGSSLNPKYWSYYYPWGARTNDANGEHQWYQSSNVALARGNLEITAKREPKPFRRTLVSGKSADFSYTSGLITSSNKMQADVGGVDVRAKAPVGPALWPAIWLLPSGSGYPPEFDVFETFGESPTIHQTAHYTGTKGEDVKKDVMVDDVDPSDGFHTYSARWDHDRVIYMVDGIVTMVVPRVNASAPLYLLLNLAVGGNFVGAPSDRTPARSTFQIDSVLFMVGDA